MRMHEIMEARPSPVLQAQKLYHGTQSRAAVNSILRDGLRSGMTTTYKGDLRPTEGRVYLTADIYTAVKYALGPAHKGNNEGYIFVINGADLTDVVPDEDDIGEFLWMHTTGHPGNSNNPPIFDAHHNTEQEERRMIWTFIMTHGSKIDLRDSLILGPKRPGGWAALGKKLQPIMPDWMSWKLIEWGASIAHGGSIQPEECWRITRNDLRNESVFDQAERIR